MHIFAPDSPAEFRSPNENSVISWIGKPAAALDGCGGSGDGASGGGLRGGVPGRVTPRGFNYVSQPTSDTPVLDSRGRKVATLPGFESCCSNSWKIPGNIRPRKNIFRPRPAADERGRSPGAGPGRNPFLRARGGSSEAGPELNRFVRALFHRKCTN